MPDGEPKRYLHPGLHPSWAKLPDSGRQRYLPRPNLHPDRAKLPDRGDPYLCWAALPDGK
jgi:hypothetical protein